MKSARNNNDPTAREVASLAFVTDCIPRKMLSYREFAEKHVVLAAGPFRGEKFSVARQPFTGVLLDEMANERWQTIYITGPSQSSKTLTGFVIPSLRDAYELHDDIILGFPEATMADDKFQKDFMPTLMASPDLRCMIPKKGSGSRGGTIKDKILLGNGRTFKIMTCGGADTSVAGYSAPRIRITEAAAWSRIKAGAVEADRIRQIQARTKAYPRKDRSIIVEGTVTVEDQLPWRAKGEEGGAIISTRSLLVSPCPHCGEWIAPEREHLVGWQGTKTEIEAADKSCFSCPECGKNILDNERRVAMADCRLLHHGQKISKRGKITGDIPPTTTLWFRWNAYHNLLLDAADTGVEEWLASQIEEGTVDRDNAERQLCQFFHAVPFKSALADNDPLDARVIRKRTEEWQRGLLPHDTIKVTVGVDIGKWTSWWLVIAWRANGCLHIPAYGAFDVMRNNSEELATRIRVSLLELKDKLEMGFPIDGKDGLHLPDAVFIDCGYRPDDIGSFVRSTGSVRKNRFHACRGRGKSTTNGGYNHPTRVGGKKIKIGRQYFIEINHDRRIKETTFNADYWKLYAQDRIRAKIGSKGACSMFRADMKNEHAKLSHHLCSEQYVKEWDQKKGVVQHWVKKGDNHWLDCMAMACAAGSFVGYDLKNFGQVIKAITPKDKPKPKKKKKPKPKSNNWYENIEASHVE